MLVNDPLQEKLPALTEAQRTCAATGLFSYPAEALQTLELSPKKLLLQLSTDERRNTALRWEQVLRSNLDDRVLLHALAVLWTWTARHDGDREAWQATIGYWCALAGIPGFWCDEEHRRMLLSSIRTWAISADSVFESLFAQELATSELLGATLEYVAEGPITFGALLRKRLELPPIDDFTPILAEKLVRRGQKRLAAAEELVAIGQDVSLATVLPEMEAGKADLLLAAELGHEHAAALVSVAERILAEARFGVSHLSGACREHARRARAEITAGNYDVAIDVLHEARELVVSGRPHILDSLLAAAIALRVRAAVQSALQSYHEGDTPASELRILVNRARDQLVEARELDHYNLQVEAVLVFLAEAEHLGGFTLSEAGQRLIERSDEAAANNDWDEAILALLDVFDEFESEQAPRFVKHRLAAMLANRAESVFEGVRTRSAPLAAHRSLAEEAKADLEAALRFHGENESSRALLSRIERVLADLPDEGVAEVLVRVGQLTAAGDYEQAIEVVRSALRARNGHPVPGLQQALAELLIGQAARLEARDSLSRLFEAHLLVPTCETTAAALEESISAVAAMAENTEAVETALALAHVNAVEGKWQAAEAALVESFPREALLIALARNAAVKTTFETKGAGRALLQLSAALPALGAEEPVSSNEILARTSQFLVEFVLVSIEQTKPSLSVDERRHVWSWFIGGEECSKALELAAHDELADACALLARYSQRIGATSRLAVDSCHCALLLAQAQQLLTAIESESVEASQHDEVLERAKRALVAAQAITQVCATEVSTLKRRYDRTVQRLGQDRLSVSTFSEDRFWLYFAIISVVAVLTVVMYSAY